MIDGKFKGLSLYSKNRNVVETCNFPWHGFSSLIIFKLGTLQQVDEV
jgi:hypothetical protein